MAMLRCDHREQRRMRGAAVIDCGVGDPLFG